MSISFPTASAICINPKSDGWAPSVVHPSPSGKLKNCHPSIKYTFFNVLTNPLSRNKCLLKYINSPITKIVYITDKHIFIYDSKQVTGVSLSDLEFYGFERERIIDILKRNSYNRLVFSDSFLNFTPYVYT